MNYDIFNGDADGIIALLQLRLANPVDSKLITGVKRDIQLLDKLSVKQGDQVTVLDISMEKNINGLNRALEAGASVFYADHHRSGDIPSHEGLTSRINLDANTCTALIIDEFLQGQFHLWAITAAYGDNLVAKANELALAVGLTTEQAEQLKELGTLINYNGYGSKVTDLHYHPADLFKSLSAYASPFEVIADKNSPFYGLREAYEEDMENALAVEAIHKSEIFSLYELPNEAWARRISGVYGNLLANQNLDSAHGVLTENSDGSYTFSLRAPLRNKQGAGDICSQFDSGGGRAAAAGINALCKQDIQKLISIVENSYTHRVIA
ncbi:DHH family phosphoesterase [Shewanella benthica]|uniref:DHH family phosphoesterase n=1 Tax=Shewanella benthica TaxID=43661 RepID=UPI00187A974A|nr:DHH family phosphoesterase [Shewanella benthica]MBE7213959.1 DHH family phosphoesterase [Shewanella benthica]MCL1063848.1 DHH family phosphoesterase [Shewanella benthica]